MDFKTTMYTHMKEQIDGIKDENIRLSEKLQVFRQEFFVYTF